MGGAPRARVAGRRRGGTAANLSQSAAGSRLGPCWPQPGSPVGRGFPRSGARAPPQEGARVGGMAPRALRKEKEGKQHHWEGEIRAGEGARRGTTRQKPREEKEEEEGAGWRKPPAGTASPHCNKMEGGGALQGEGAAGPRVAAASLGPCPIPSRDSRSGRCLALCKAEVGAGRAGSTS